MATQIHRTRTRRRDCREGVAAVECAVIAPLLTLLVLGAIDVGQYANVYQKVSDASREGARMAARYQTATTSEVQAAVMDYLKQTSPGASASTLASAAQITVTGADGAAITGGDLTKIPSGTQLNVQVILQYQPVRWIGAFNGLDGRQIATTTMMRRE